MKTGLSRKEIDQIRKRSADYLTQIDDSRVVPQKVSSESREYIRRLSESTFDNLRRKGILVE